MLLFHHLSQSGPGHYSEARLGGRQMATSHRGTQVARPVKGPTEVATANDVFQLCKDSASLSPFAPPGDRVFFKYFLTFYRLSFKVAKNEGDMNLRIQTKEFVKKEKELYGQNITEFGSH